MTRLRRKLLNYWLRIAALVALTASCSPAVEQRELCYARADVQASQRAFNECDAGWSKCPTRQAIIDEQRSAYGRCP